MRISLLGLLVPSVLVSIAFAPPFAFAQLQGTDCSTKPAGAAMLTADSDLDGTNVILICDGALWRPLKLEVPQTAGGTAVISNDVDGAEGVLDGTWDDYPDKDTIIIGTNIDDNVIIGSFYEGWLSIYRNDNVWVLLLL